MRKLTLLWMMLVAVGAWGQQYQYYTGKSSFADAVSTTTVATTKPCAFGFMPKSIFGIPKPAPPTPKKELNDALNVSPFTTTTTGLYYHQVCPYERAIELFGQDRVEYQESRTFFDVPDCDDPGEFVDPKTHQCGRLTRQILVDGEVVYEEPAK